MIINAQPHLGGVNAIVVAIHRINLVDWSSHSGDISFMASENASQCFHNAIQLGSSIHHWAGESLLIGWRADWHSPAEEGHGFWRSGRSECREKKWEEVVVVAGGGVEGYNVQRPVQKWKDRRTFVAHPQSDQLTLTPKKLCKLKLKTMFAIHSVTLGT